LASARSKSLESVAREALTALATGERTMAPTSNPPGMAEAPMPWPMPLDSAASFETLWGALKGKVHVAASTDITAPTGEAWNAEAGTL
jgi:hypothetical protein